MNLQSNEQSNCFDVCNVYQHASRSQIRQALMSHNLIHDEDGLTTEDDRRKKNEMDEVLAQTMNGLTFEERQQHQEVLHGVDERIISEEASFVDDKLEQLDLHLMWLKEGSMYEVAEKMDPSYVNNKAFRIMFLRANEYDPNDAADQMIRFFQSKYELFGENKLAKDITMEDLDEDDIASLELGWIQNIGRDRSGRHVFSIFAGRWRGGDGSKALMSCLRVQYYFTMKMLQSEETQLRGTVTILYNVGSFKNAKSSGYKELYEAARVALPKKTSAMHHCIDTVSQYVHLNLVLKMMKDVLRARFRMHFGSHMECQYQLTTFGIPSALIPVDCQGRLDLTRHIHWIRHSCAIEDNVRHGPAVAFCGSSQTTTKPNQNDVLFSNGRSGSYHVGNKQFRALVQDYSQAYADSSNDLAKREIVRTIVSKVHVSGGRFLKQSGDSTTDWEEVPPTELRKKIMQSFRNRRRVASGPRHQSAASIAPRGVLIAGDPRPNDVIFGRTSQRNLGNELLNQLIKENFNEYESLDRGKKMLLVESMMQQVKDQNGRFVQSDPETRRWIEVFDDNAGERISKSFRNLRRQNASKANY